MGSNDRPGAGVPDPGCTMGPPRGTLVQPGQLLVESVAARGAGVTRMAEQTDGWNTIGGVWRRAGAGRARVCARAGLCLLACGGGADAGAPTAARPPSYEERFDGDQAVAARGWEVRAEPAQSVWRVEDGHLALTCHRNPYKGGRIVRQVPLLERGILEFDTRLAVLGGSDYNHFSLGFKLYGHMSSFKKFGMHMWLGYRPERKSWVMLSTDVPVHKWVHVKLLFDLPRGRMEYYCGEAEDPAYIETSLGVDPEQAPPELEFFNYGLCTGTLEHWIDNVVLRPLTRGVGAGDVQRDRALVFEGVAADRYGVTDILKQAFGDEQVSVFRMESRGAAIAPRNKFGLERLPSAQRWDEAATVVLLDVPAVPADCLPPYVLADLCEAVLDGADLLVFGGMFAFGKGGYVGTPLAGLLPVAVEGPWRVRKFDGPCALRSETPPWAQVLASGDARPTLSWYHDLVVRGPDADVLLTAGKEPMLVRRQAGKGTVTAFFGVPCGEPIGGQGGVPFWAWGGWPELVRRMADRGSP